MIEKGRFNFEGGLFEYDSVGVRYIYLKSMRENETEEVVINICGPLVVDAISRNSLNMGWGRVLHWRDEDDNEHTLAIPMSMLQGDGRVIREILADGGLKLGLDSKKKYLLLGYISNFPVNKRVICTSRTGWNDNSYVFVNGCIGEKVIYQGDITDPIVSRNGRIEDWINNVSKLCEGNSRLVFSVALSLTGPVLAKINYESFGVNLFGRSSIGKTTSAKVATSVFGCPSNMRSWLTTSNGIEATALEHCDLFLSLDELGQADPIQISKSAYLLANGSGKSRANLTGKSKELNKWRLTFLSTGEVTLSDIKIQNGMKVNVGEEVRLLDIPADAGVGMGLFEDTHGLDSCKFSDELIFNVNRYYGSVGYEWIGCLVKNHQMISEINDLANQYMTYFNKDDIDSSAHKRVSKHFCLVAAIGEVATSQGFTGWKVGASLQAAMACYYAWHENFGTGIKEEKNIVQAIRKFIEYYGSTKFELYPNTTGMKVLDRVGYKKIASDGSERYLVNDESLQSMAGCSNIKLIRDALVNASLLVTGGDGRLVRKERLPGTNKIERINVISLKVEGL